MAHATQLVQRPLGAPVAHQTRGRVQDLGPAAQRREAQQELVLRGTECGARQQVFERHEITGGERRPHARLHGVGQLDRLHDPVEELGMADVDLIAPQARRLQTSSRQGDDLRVGDRAARANQLRADLVGLAPLVEAPGIRGQDRARVAEPHRQRRRAQLARDQPGDRHCALAHQRDHVATGVRELEQPAPLLGAETELEHIRALDHRRDHMPVAPPPHLREERLLRLAYDLRLFRQEIAESRNAA